jgi:hypothetical protein
MTASPRPGAVSFVSRGASPAAADRPKAPGTIAAIKKLPHVLSLQGCGEMAARPDAAVSWPGSGGSAAMIDAAEALDDYRRRHPGVPLPPAGQGYRQVDPELIRCMIRPSTAEIWLEAHFTTPQAKAILLEISARYAAIMAAGGWEDRGDDDPVVVHATPNRAGRRVWNGAHRLGAVMILGRPFVLPIRFCR